ncbi:MAG TPA: phosphoglucosamine mutase [Pyrinomonadaceae bacterium]|nr:phosphoglucosamine mutase [Pyrinomonadaceae bacterium]
MSKLFGTDGIRGEAGKYPLDVQTVETIGRSLAGHLAQRKNGPPRIVIGRDTRESGPWIEQALIRGALQHQAEVHSAGIITTPGIAFLARTLPADAGVVISASHNPYQDNGIKVFEPSGRKLNDVMERRIEGDVAAAPPSEQSGNAVANQQHPADESADLKSRYFSYLANDVAQELELANLKMAVDCANGAAYEIAPRLFAELGAMVVTINDQPDGRNINRDCGSLHIEGLQKLVRESRADLGVAFDGDADRALFVDEAGQFVDGDATMWVLANYLQKRNQLAGNTVVATVMSNIGLEIALRSAGIELKRADVGDKYVLEELIRSGATLGGEQSGHIIFPGLSLAGDGMLTTISLLRAMRDEKMALSKLTAGMQRYPQLLVNVRVKEKRPFNELPEVQAVAREIETELGDRGRLLLRYSGTESLARVMIEGEAESTIKAQAERLADAIRRELGAGES